MQEMVFVGNSLKDEPYTTADAIAQYAEVQRGTVDRLIRTHTEALQKLGKLGFEIRPLPKSKTGQSIKIYHLNEQQATLLITFLKNTSVVVAFKTELVRQFYAMRKELTKRRTYRAELKPTSRTLADTIKECTPSEHLHLWTYSNYFSLAHKAALGISTSKLKKQREIPNGANIPDYLNADEIERVRKAETAIMALLDVGMDYKQIKDTLLCKARRAA